MGFVEWILNPHCNIQFISSLFAVVPGNNWTFKVTHSPLELWRKSKNWQCAIPLFLSLRPFRRSNQWILLFLLSSAPLSSVAATNISGHYFLWRRSRSSLLLCSAPAIVRTFPDRRRFLRLTNYRVARQDGKGGAEPVMPHLIEKGTTFLTGTVSQSFTFPKKCHSITHSLC